MIASERQVVWDVACLGELVMDLVPHSKSGDEWLYVPSPGGAPGNVAVGLARLGRRVVMLGKVGEDGFGDMIVSALDRYGVDTSGVTRAAREKTGLSVVTLGRAGEREFIFYRDNPADLTIDLDDINPELIERATISHFGVLPISAPRSAAAQRKAISLANAAGRLVSVDPNFRPALWQDRDAMLFAARELIAQADIVKLSEDELFGLTEMSSIEEAARSLWHKRLKIMAVTKGAHGAELFTSTERFICSGYAVEAIDTTAAGDAFMASLLSGLLEIAMQTTNHHRLAQILRSACAAGALATTMRGPMGSMPGKEDITLFISGRGESRD
jgi:fructokinase